MNRPLLALADAGRFSTSDDSLLRLDGELLVDPASLDFGALDYGRIVRKTPAAVLRPRSHEDVVRMVRYCNRNRIPVTVRGQGHSGYGQTQNEGGLLIDMATLDAVREIGDGYAVVDGGCLWRRVLDEALLGERPQTPPVMNGFSLLSVGGTLSAGGISGMAYHQGCQVEHVLELKVVTGEGDVVVCSPTEERALFEAVLAGQGQCAVILGVKLKLVPAPPRTRDFTLVFPTLDALMTAMNTLLDEAKAKGGPVLDLIWGSAAKTPNGFVYPLFANKHYDPAKGGPPKVEDLFASITLPMPPIEEDLSWRAYIDKIDQQILAIPTGEGRYPLFFDVFVSQDRLLEYAGGIIDGTQPDDMGDAGLVLFFPLETATNTRPLLRLPDAPRVFLFDYFRLTNPIAKEEAEALLQRNGEWYRRGLEVGATYYTIGSVPLTHEEWKAHYGSAWPAFEEAKTRFDPNGILGTGVPIFRPH